MRRRLLIVVIFLLAGAVVNVAVAWGCCFASKGFGDGTKLGFAEIERIADDLRLPSQLRAYESGYKLPRYIRWDGGFTVASGFGSRLDNFRIHPQSDRFPVFGGGRNKRVQAGWPALALRGYQIIEVDQLWSPVMGNYRGPEYRWMHVLMVSVRRPPVLLPLRPNWPGFAVNTLFYAALLWLPFVVWRWVRVRRGFCPKCAYPMGESSVCSECGKALPDRARVAI